MKINTDQLSRPQVESIILSYPGVQPADNGFEIPMREEGHRGRVHIHHCSEGLEVHYDRVVGGNKHKVVNSAVAKEVHATLKNMIQSYATTEEKS